MCQQIAIHYWLKTFLILVDHSTIVLYHSTHKSEAGELKVGSQSHRLVDCFKRKETFSILSSKGLFQENL